MNNVFAYNPESGHITWLINAAKNVRAGSIAGYIHNDHRNQYRVVTYKRKLMKAHRLAWFLHYGEWPDGQIDHINGNGLDNRICNLRIVDTQGNQKNRVVAVNSTSGFTGVVKDKRTGNWNARIKINGKESRLGAYKTHYAACYARHAANIEHGFVTK